MTPGTDLTRAPTATFERLEALTDRDALSRILGPISGLEREPLSPNAAGFSSSRHELLHVRREGLPPITLRLKRTHIGQDWLARLMRDEPPGREAALLAEPKLAPAWDAFARPHLAYAVEGSEVGLLMEDHSAHVLPDVREPIAPELEERLLDAIARLHARFWQSPALSLPWLARGEGYADVLGPVQALDEEALRTAPASIRNGVRAGWEDASRLLPPEVARALRRPAAEAWARWTDLPRTLIHGDSKVANFAFLPDGRVAAFDWSALGAAPATLELGWYVAVNGTRLTRSKDELIARYRELLEARLGRTLDAALWDRMVDAAIYSGARMLLWSKALGLRENTDYRRSDWAWWVEKLEGWCAR